MKQILLLIAMTCIITPAIAQDIIIGSEEFYDLYSWDANASFTQFENPPEIFFYDIDQDGEDDFRIYISINRNGNRVKAVKQIQGVGNFSIIGKTGCKYIKNDIYSQGVGYRFNTNVYSYNAAEPYYQGDTVFNDSNFLSSDLTLCYYCEWFLEINFVSYDIDLFQKDNVYITAKKTVGSEEYIYIIKVIAGSGENNSVKFRNVYTNDVLFSDIDEQSSGNHPTFFPNPAKTTITLPQQTSQISVFSGNGTLLATDEIEGERDYNISFLESGSYILQFTCNGETYSQKLIKQ